MAWTSGLYSKTSWGLVTSEQVLLGGASICNAYFIIRWQRNVIATSDTFRAQTHICASRLQTIKSGLNELPVHSMTWRKFLQATLRTTGSKAMIMIACCQMQWGGIPSKSCLTFAHTTDGLQLAVEPALQWLLTLELQLYHIWPEGFSLTDNSKSCWNLWLCWADALWIQGFHVWWWWVVVSAREDVVRWPYGTKVGWSELKERVLLQAGSASVL